MDYIFVINYKINVIDFNYTFKNFYTLYLIDSINDT